MKKIVCVVLSVCLMLLATSCNFLIKSDSEGQYDYPVTVGNTVLESSPDGVVVLSENLADVVIACGYEGKLLARSDSCVQESIQRLPSVGTPDSPDVRKIKELSPGLVLTDKIFDDKTKDAILDSGAKILVIKPASNKKEISKLYSNVASVLGGGYTGKMKAMDTVEAIQGTLDSMESEISGDDVVSTFCYIYDINGDQCRVAYGSGYTADLFDYAELTNIAADDDDGLIGLDVLLRGNPDAIFCDEGVAEKLMSNNDLKTLSAVAYESVFTLPRKYLTLQGKTCLITADYIIAKTHENYTPKQEWPEEWKVVKKQPYVAPFKPKEGIFYTVGETYSPIKYIEDRLIELGYMTGESDQSYTQETADAISKFQSANGIEVTGIADYETQKILLSDAAVPAK